MLKSFFPWLARKREVCQLALRAEQQAWELNGLPRVNPPGPEADILKVLRSTCELLEQLANRLQNHRHAPESWEAGGRQETSSLEPPTAFAQEQGTATEPSKTAKELIRLRDWLRVAQTGAAAEASNLLEALYEELGRVLEKEQVQALEDTGSYDAALQQVVDTRLSDDPMQDNLVCHTVRPGYRFRGKLIRPQEVVIYVHRP